MDGDNRAVHPAGKMGLERFKSDIRGALYNAIQFCQKWSVEGRAASPSLPVVEPGDAMLAPERQRPRRFPRVLLFLIL